jgi:thymidine kinase
MSIEIITGPMFSSKSSTLLGRLERDAAIGIKILYINHSLDANRFDPDTSNQEVFSTHSPLHKLAKLSSIDNFKSMLASELPPYSQLSEYHTIGIDEAQFFPNLDETVNYAEKNHSRVIVAGLIGTSNRDTFGGILSLVPKANKFKLLSAYCVKCKEITGKIDPSLRTPAHFSHKLSKCESVIDVGGADKYIPVCRKHYIELNSK